MREFWFFLALVFLVSVSTLGIGHPAKAANCSSCSSLASCLTACRFQAYAGGRYCMEITPAANGGRECATADVGTCVNNMIVVCGVFHWKRCGATLTVANCSSLWPDDNPPYDWEVDGCKK